MHRGAAARANCKLIGDYLVHVGSPSHMTDYQVELISVQLRRLVKTSKWQFQSALHPQKQKLVHAPSTRQPVLLAHFVRQCSFATRGRAPQTALSLAHASPPPLPAGGKVGKPMDERIEAFLKDVLALEGEISNLLRQGVRRYLAICEKQFHDDETNKRMKDRAVQACRTLCRMRVADEIRRRKGTSTAEHLKVVLSIIDSAALYPMNDD
jgi:hypothetical protein